MSYVKHTDHKVRFWSVRLHGTLGPFWDDLVVTCTCRGPCAGLEVLRDAYVSLGVQGGMCPAYRGQWLEWGVCVYGGVQGVQLCKRANLLSLGTGFQNIFTSSFLR